MALAPQLLRILAFPQRIAGDQLEVNVLLLPTQRLLNFQQSFPGPGGNVDLPDFISANLQLEARTIRGLSTYPFSDPIVLANEGVTVTPIPTPVALPANLPALYEGLASRFKLDTSAIGTNTGAGAVWSESRGIRKYLPKSYRQAFNFTTPRTDFARTDDSYRCAIENAPKPDPTFKNSPDEITWGRVIAFCLRQPLLAEAIGLLHRMTLTLPSADYFADGGWIYFHLTSPMAEFHITNAGNQLREYAARIPIIDEPRQIFAALLFPVVAGPAVPAGEFDILKIETADYDDGFAKIIHANQPVSANLLAEEPDGIHVQKEAGIRLGWDDEQLLIWQNRQVLADALAGDRIDAPLGVFTYRVDVREKRLPEPDWTSLVLTRNKAELLLAGESIAPAHTPVETGVQVFPAQLNADPATTYWLPSFFTQWYGPSLVLPDDRAAQLDESGALADPGSYHDANITAKQQVSGLYEPVLPADPELKYGKQYEFRVRLGDLTGGGPKVEEQELNDAPASSASIIFKRFVAPKQLKVTPVDPQPNPVSPTNIFYEGTSFEISRPRLGYPALLFTEMDTNDAFQKLLDDKAFLHTGKVGLEKIKEQREVSYFDPDVDQFMVIVEIKSLLGDNLASLTQREAFIPLYTTFRSFANDLEEPFELDLEYRTANVIDFGNQNNFGELLISQAEIDAASNLVLPRSRDIRITLLPVCSEKPASPEYFGFHQTSIAGQLVLSGEPTQFFVREDAENETTFFKQSPESQRLKGIYLQPDNPQVFNAATFITEIVAGKELEQSVLVQRLAAELDLNFKGMTLIGRSGERIQFGCSKRIRHTLAPDNSSITFSTKADLINHWLCVLSFEVNRDWTWRGMSNAGIEITRDKGFTDEPATAESEVVGNLQLKESANVVALKKPDRSYTRIVFIDAVEPKKPLDSPATQANPFPNTINLDYTLKPIFIDSVDPADSAEQSVTCDVRLPVTTVPSQVPKVVAAGFALSPYQRDEVYSETATRRRYLWLEFADPIADPHDNYFARVLTYAPDPLLSFPNLDQVFIKQDDPPLRTPIAPIRVITKGHGTDNAGLDDMQPMTPEVVDPDALIQISPIHFLLPLPEGLHNESPELFGFFTYELRVGHAEEIWSTAEGRWGHPIRLNGVQHPAPPLKCLVDRTPKKLSITAQYAAAVFNGRDVTSKPPKTEIWCMLYAQVKQADDVEYRNILLAEQRMDYVNPAEKMKAVPGGVSKLIQANSLLVNVDAPATAIANWAETEIQALLKQFNLLKSTRVSVLAVEMMPRYEQYIFHGQPTDQLIHPLSRELGQYRILRTSRLVSAPEVC